MPEPTDKKLEIQKMLNTLDPERLDKKTFVDAFEQVVNLVLAKDKKLEEAINRLEQTYQGLLKFVSEKHDVSLKELKSQVNEIFVGERVKKMEDDYSFRMTMGDSKIKELESKIMDKLSKVKDGYTPIKDKDYFDGVSAKMPTKDEIKSLLSPFVDEATKEIKEEIKKQLSSIPRGKGMRKVPIFQSIDLTSSVDGATTAFTLPRDTTRVFGVFSTQFPGVFNTSDWSLSGNTLTLNFTLQQGQSLVVFYETLFYA